VGCKRGVLIKMCRIESVIKHRGHGENYTEDKEEYRSLLTRTKSLVTIDYSPNSIRKFYDIEVDQQTQSKIEKFDMG